MAHHVRLSRPDVGIRLIDGHSHNEMKDLRCMSYTNKGTGEILVAGLQDQMFVIDVEKGTIAKQVLNESRPPKGIYELSFFRFQPVINIPR